MAGLAHVSIDLRVLAFTLAISVITGRLCGLAPALGWTRPEITAILEQSGRQGASQERHRLRGALVVVEASSAVVLLISEPARRRLP